MVAALARDAFGRLLAIGLVVMLFVQMLINTGMTIGLLPITGMTLPFVSSGGSSLLMTWIHGRACPERRVAQATSNGAMGRFFRGGWVMDSTREVPEVCPPTEEFIDSAHEAGIVFEEGDLARLETYLQLLYEANTRMNLTGVRNPRDAWMRHIFDSLTLLHGCRCCQGRCTGSIA